MKSAPQKGVSKSIKKNVPKKCKKSVPKSGVLQYLKNKCQINIAMSKIYQQEFCELTRPFLICSLMVSLARVKSFNYIPQMGRNRVVIKLLSCFPLFIWEVSFIALLLTGAEKGCKPKLDLSCHQQAVTLLGKFRAQL